MKNKDTIIGELERRIRNIVEIYKNKGMSVQDIRIHFLEPKNFKKIIKVLGDIKHIYNEQGHPIKFESVVHDLLFCRITLERKPWNESDTDCKDNL